MPESKTKPRGIRLSDDDWTRLDSIRKHLDTINSAPVPKDATLADAIRYAIRETIKTVNARK